MLMAALAVVLTTSGLWSALNYRTFIAALSEGAARQTYRAAAERVLALEENDPALAIYPQQAGLLLSLAAAEGDAEAGVDAIAQFRRYTALEPAYASGWANLAALYFAGGDLTPAADAMRKAVELAPRSWLIVYRYGVYAEAAGHVEAAHEAYAQGLTLNSGLFLLPEWNQSPIRREFIIDESTIFPPVKVLMLLEEGDLTSARQVWDAARDVIVDSSPNHIVEMLLALARGDRAGGAARPSAVRRADRQCPSCIAARVTD
jgi:tetratricopeptide (TPR) repeat protein